jgi:multidrug efflux pump subunit AcrB
MSNNWWWRCAGAANERKPVFLSDVATVEDGPNQPKAYAWFGSKDGEFPAVTLQISKQPGVNAADVANAAVNRIDDLKNTVIPEGVEVTVTRNYGETATEKAQKLIGKLIFATAFVVLLVFFALGKREAVIVGVAVTLTLAATLFASWAWGFTLNRVSLFALIFSIGILVDDAIVVVENIHRWQGLYPEKSLLEIIPPAVDEVGGPTILATLTVIAALLPMAFVTGLMGPYMSPIPINSSMGMAISLAVAFVVTPWLALKLMKSHGGAHGQQTSRLDAKLDSTFRKLLTPFLDPIKGAAMRLKLAIAIVLLILGSVSLAYFQLVVLKMLPFDNKSEFQIIVDMPLGTPLEETARVLREIGSELAQEPDVVNYQAYAGTASPINFNGLVRQYYLRAVPEKGDIQVNLADKQQRTRKSHEIAISLRDRIEAIGKKNGGVAKVVEVPPGPPVISPIVAEIYGPDMKGQMAVGKEVRKAFEKTPDIVAVDDYIEADSRKFVLHVLQSKAALLGVAQSDIVEVVSMGLAGQDVTPARNTDSKFEIPVRITLPAEKQSNLDALLKLRVRSRDGQLVPVSELVEVRDAAARKGHLSQGSAAGGLRRRRHGRQARFAALRHVRHPLADQRHGAERGRHARRMVHPPAERPLRWLQRQMGRRMAGDLRNLPRHGHRLRCRPDPDLPAGRRPLRQLSGAADHHGADSADHHRRHARPRAIRFAIHRNLDDRHDRPGRHHRPQFHPAGRFHPATSRHRHALPRSRHPVGCSARQADCTDRPGRHARRDVHPRRPDLQRAGPQPDLRHPVSTLLTLVVIPVLYFSAFRKEHQA